jgi:hypothetical protein
MASRATSRVVVVLLALATAAMVAACGSSSGSGSASAQQLLQDTFGGHHPVKSGVLTFGLTLTPSGSSTLNSPVSLTVHGPFQSRGPGKLPESNFTIALNALGRRGQMGLISTGTSGYIIVDGNAYKLPAAAFSKLASSFSSVGASGSGGGISKLGIHPLQWVTDPSIVGTTTIGGTSTTHIRAGINVAALLDGVNKLLHTASSTGAGSRIPRSISAATRQKIAREVQHPTIDVWTGSSDHTLRRFSLSLGFPVTGQTSALLGGLHSAGFGLTLQYVDLNQPQTISAPTNVKPFKLFDRKLRGIVRQLEGVTGSGSLGSLGSGTSGSSAAGSTRSGVSKYAKCIQNAHRDVTKMQKCAGLLNGSGG